MILIWVKKFLGLREREGAVAVRSPEETVRLIQDGQENLRNEFITAYQPYVMKLASRFKKRFVDPERDDEFAIALVAFNESIDSFRLDSGASFLGFADTVIRRRLIDYARKEKRHSSQLPYSAFDVEDDEENVINIVEVEQAVKHHSGVNEEQERRFEIEELSIQLQQFGISFHELVEGSPKHVDSRENLMSIGVQLAKNDKLMDQLLLKGTLPIKELLDLISVSRKTIERNRKYIIAVALVHSGTYPYLQQFLTGK